jgi:hypothetical protein
MKIKCGPTSAYNRPPPADSMRVVIWVALCYDGVCWFAITAVAEAWTVEQPKFDNHPAIS